MRIALVYDYLNQLGGGERVLQVLAEMFPEAPIYTIFHDSELTQNQFSHRKIFTSFLDFNFARRHHRFFIPLLPAAVGSLNLGANYDLIVSCGAGYSQGISYAPSAKHLYYCFTPLRYAWEQQLIPPSLQSLKIFTEPFRNYLRRWNRRTAQHPDKIITISRHIANKIQTNFHRSAEIIYPPYDRSKFFLELSAKKENYFLAVSRLLHYKKIDLLINVFNQLDLPLKIVGGGPEENRLKKMIRSPKIEMLGFIKDDNEIRRLYNSASAVLFPQEEDFGLVAVEAIACGTPVIAYKGGGALDVVEEGKNGVFFQRQAVNDLIAAIKRFYTLSFNRQLIGQSAACFSLANFQNKFFNEIKKL